MKNKMTVIKGMLTAVAVILVGIAGLIASYKTAPPAQPSLGAVSGNEVQGNEIIVGGLTSNEGQIPFGVGTTTPCAVKITATSTLLFASANYKTATSTAQKITIAKGSTAWATTTAIVAKDFAATQGGVVYTMATTSDAVFIPGQYLVVGIEGNPGHSVLGGGDRLGDNVAGTCDFVFARN